MNGTIINSVAKTDATFFCLRPRIIVSQNLQIAEDVDQ